MIMNSQTYIAVPPGETIKEQLEIYGISKQEFTKRMAMPENFIDDLLDGNVILTSEIADKVEKAMGLPAKILLRLEKSYREKIKLVNAENLSKIKISV